MKNKTLLVLAAGMGSRFGGLKQIEPIGPNGEFIIHYSVYDAIKSGFNKIVFVIKEENLNIFKEKIGKYIEEKVKVEYVFQKNNNLEGLDLDIKREKPWGTAHAILSAKDVINENFLIINADDFYGLDAYEVASKYLELMDENTTNYGIVGYNIKNTVNNTEEVKRGIIKEENGDVKEIIESKLKRIEDNKYLATPLNLSESFYLTDNTIVSMNMICFTKEIFKYLSSNFKKFINDNKNDLLTCEYLIPEVLSKSIKENIAKVKLLKTNSVWHGMTYKEDKIILVNEINKLIENNKIPKNLF